ncbi:fatty acid desaturase [Vibrio maritimus]|uniref:Fatty acid desaturase n=1 Tax=Vibrio maritimus TaxID=990268 RepID=A0A090RWZ2_9VIBR|nr:fatty acid desaturase [Vibrio maritimus]
MLLYFAGCLLRRVTIVFGPTKPMKPTRRCDISLRLAVLLRYKTARYIGLRTIVFITSMSITTTKIPTLLSVDSGTRTLVGCYGNIRLSVMMITVIVEIYKRPVVMWQHKHYVLLALLTNFGIPIALGLLYGDLIGFVLVGGALRLVLSHHTTFFINSLAHIWGTQPYTSKNTARDNGILAFFTFGEGYHNFHHIFEHDYRNGIRWWQFDPTKWLIRGSASIGLAQT